MLLYQRDNVICIKEVDTESQLHKAISEILDRLNFNFDNDDYIIIKPNLCDYRPPEEGGTTDVQIIESLIAEINKRAQPQIAIIESDHAMASADEEFERMGYTTLTKKFDNVNLVNLSKNEKKQFRVINGNHFKSFRVPVILLEMTKFISVAKLKTHLQQRITCIMKNQFGLIPTKFKSRYHPNLSAVLLDLHEFFTPDLCIIDGIVGMEAAGPSDGDKIETNLIIGGTDYLTTDIVAAKIMGIRPKSVPTIRYAMKNRKDKIYPPTINGTIKNNKYKFIPFYSYRLQRFSYWLERLANRISGVSSAFSSFLSEFSMGLIVLRRGYYITSPVGLISRTEVSRYGFGLLRRPWVSFKLKSRRKKVLSLLILGVLVSIIGFSVLAILSYLF